MNEKVNVSEGTIASFLIGFAYNCGNGIRLSKENNKITDKINFRMCHSINREIFWQIENKIFEKKLLLPHINTWYELCDEDKCPQIKTKQKLFLKHHDVSSNTIKITQEMLFAFFCGISNSMPEDYTRSQFYDVYDKYLNKISKEFCDNIDDERLCDVEHFLNSNQILFEIRDSIIMASGVKPAWSYPVEHEPEDDDEAMLRRFQEKFK